MRWSGRSAAVLLLIAAGAALASDSFLSDNPKAPDAIPYRRDQMAPTAAPTTATPATPAATPAP
jgi:hypothetical protein